MSGEKYKITKTETTVLIGVAKGYATKEIAFDMGRSHKTVEKHRANLCKKLNVSSIAGCVLRAVEMGLVTPEDAR